MKIEIVRQESLHGNEHYFNLMKDGRFENSFLYYKTRKEGDNSEAGAYNRALNAAKSLEAGHIFTTVYTNEVPEPNNMVELAELTAKNNNHE